LLRTAVSSRLVISEETTWIRAYSRRGCESRTTPLVVAHGGAFANCGFQVMRYPLPRLLTEFSLEEESGSQF